MGKTIKVGPPNGKYGKWLEWFRPEVRDEFDSLPRPYEGQTVFVVGGGPSINHTPLQLIKHRAVVGCNDAFRLGEWVDWLVFADRRWWMWNSDEVAQWKNRERVVSLVPQLLDERIEKWPWLKILRRDEGRFGLSVEQDTCCWNRGCGGAAINVAYLLGAAQIVLLGFDMRMVQESHNWHGHHQKQERPQIYQNSMIPFLKPMSDAMKVTGLQIVNATPRSAMDLFPVMTLEEVLEMGW